MLRVRRRCAQTAHISLQIHQFQRAQTQNTQQTRTSGLSAVVYPIIPCCRLRPPPVPFRRFRVVSSSVRRYLGPLNKTRKRKKPYIRIFFTITRYATISWGFGKLYHNRNCAYATLLRRDFCIYPSLGARMGRRTLRATSNPTTTATYAADSTV
jgi:hypothetical protein